jgi:hypothetical protein
MLGISLGRTAKVEEHAFFILFIGILLIIFWHAVWELLNELTEYLHTKWGVKKWKIYTLSLLMVILMIGIFPQILEKL